MQSGASQRTISKLARPVSSAEQKSNITLRCPVFVSPLSSDPGVIQNHRHSKVFLSRFSGLRRTGVAPALVVGRFLGGEKPTGSACWAHIPAVAGSIPAPAPKETLYAS